MNFREYRESKGYSTKKVAELLMIEPRTLNRKERNNNFTNKQKAFLCNLYEIKKIDDVDDLEKIK